MYNRLPSAQGNLRDKNPTVGIAPPRFCYHIYKSTADVISLSLGILTLLSEHYSTLLACWCKAYKTRRTAFWFRWFLVGTVPGSEKKQSRHRSWHDKAYHISITDGTAGKSCHEAEKHISTKYSDVSRIRQSGSKEWERTSRKRRRKKACAKREKRGKRPRRRKGIGQRYKYVRGALSSKRGIHGKADNRHGRNATSQPFRNNSGTQSERPQGSKQARKQ